MLAARLREMKFGILLFYELWPRVQGKELWAFDSLGSSLWPELALVAPSATLANHAKKSYISEVSHVGPTAKPLLVARDRESLLAPFLTAQLLVTLITVVLVHAMPGIVSFQRYTLQASPAMTAS